MKARIVGTTIGAVILAFALAAIAMPRSQLRGRPQVPSGHELGYYLWMDGSILHVRWTTLNPENHSFRGEVTVPSGELTNLERVNLEDSDRTTLESPQRMEWNATEHLGLDGFDLTLPGPAHVSMTIDNHPADKTTIFLGSRRKNPPAPGDLDIAAR
jgi:hypothetical protein